VNTARARRFLVLALAALAVVALAACGSSKKSSSSDASGDPAAIMPASTTIYVEANVNPSANQKAAFNSLAQNALGISDPGQKIVAALDKSAAKDGTTFEKDIKPWLGDKVAIGITKLGKTASASTYAAVIDTTDPKQAMDALKKSKQNLRSGSINGVDYLTDGNIYAGTIDNYLIVAQRAGFAAIAGGKGDKLADQDTFKQARAKAPADRLAYAYVDFDAFLNYAASTQAALQGQLGTFKGLFGNLKALSASLVAGPTSLEIDASVVGINGSKAPSGASAVPLGKLPGTAWAGVSVRNLGPLLIKELNALGKIGASSNGQDFGQILARLKAATGLDVQNDILSWIGDSGAFIEGTSAADLGGAVIINSTDPAKSQAAIGKISGLLAALGRTATKIPVQGGTGIEIATTATGPKVQLAAVGSKFYIAFGATALKDAMSPGTTLDSNANYNAAAASLKGTEPKLYLNLQTVLSFADQFAGSNAAYEKVKPYLDRFTSLIAGYSDGTAKIIVNVKPNGGPITTTPSTSEPTATAASDPSGT
jgi:Protein of unknown function (DUF3352)